MRDNFLCTAASIFMPSDSETGEGPVVDMQNRRGTHWREDSGGPPDLSVAVITTLYDLHRLTEFHRYLRRSLGRPLLRQSRTDASDQPDTKGEH
jgi:hypothetical protein